MRIGIIGAGAIGLLFSCYLSKSHHVTIYCRTEKQALEINQKGLFITYQEKQENLRIQAKESGSLMEEDLIIIAVKQYHLQKLVPLLKRIPLSIPILFIQNGIGHLPIIDSLPHKNVLLGVVEHGAIKLNETNVHHTGMGKTKIAVYRWDGNFFLDQIHRFQSDNFPILFEHNYEEMLMEKLIANALINPLTAILKVENGELIENRFFFQLFEMVFNEVCTVLNVSNRDSALQRVITICRSTANNQSSMLKDVLNGRQTEIDAIVGELIKKATTKGQSVPFLQFMYISIKGMET